MGRKNKASSLVNQANRAFNRIMAIGHSRHADKALGLTVGKIYSYRSRATYQGHAIAALKWIKANRRPDLRELRDVQPEDFTAWVRDLEARGLAGGTIRAATASITKLDAALRTMHWYTGPALMQTTTTTPRNPPRYGLSQDEAHRLLDNLAGEPKLAARLALHAGLRIDEISVLRQADLDRTAGTIRVQGKGGRIRTVSHIRDPQLLTDLPTGGNYLWRAPGRTFATHCRTQLAAARDHASLDDRPGFSFHALRATYAETFIRAGIAAGQPEAAVRDALTHQLGHSRRAVTYRYCPRVT